jgi:hypothetical protein
MSLSEPTQHALFLCPSMFVILARRGLIGGGGQVRSSGRGGPGGTSGIEFVEAARPTATDQERKNVTKHGEMKGRGGGGGWCRSNCS